MAPEREDMKTRERESGDGEEKETDKTKTITTVSPHYPPPSPLRYKKKIHYIYISGLQIKVCYKPLSLFPPQSVVLLFPCKT